MLDITNSELASCNAEPYAEAIAGGLPSLASEPQGWFSTHSPLPIHIQHGDGQGDEGAGTGDFNLDAEARVALL